MIKPLYFPNVYIPEILKDILGEYFNAISVYDVTGTNESLEEELSGGCAVEVIRPCFDDSGNLLSYLMNGFNATPIYDAEQATHVGADLLKMVSGSVTEPGNDGLEQQRILRARVFLYMASEYDAQSREINAELMSIQKRRTALFAELDGGMNGRTDDRPDNGNRIEFQTIKRLESWAVIFGKAASELGKSGNGFFLTDIDAIVEHIIEFEPSVEHICDISVNEFEKTELSEYIKQLTTCEWAKSKNSLIGTKGTPANGGQLSVYIIPEKGPVELFNMFSNGLNVVRKEKKHINDVRNTVIALIKK